MNWNWVSSSHPISDIRDWNNFNRLEIRPDFQRQEVWSEAANILLMDTILKNIPMPKIFLKAVIRDNDTYRIIIDGQQRIKAILSFIRNELKLKKPYDGPYINCIFSELPKEIKEAFLSYKIDINEIRNAPDNIVREIYSRVNKYNIALNKQELRRADFPGDFLNLSEDLAQHPFFDDSKIFSVANRRRMGDVEYTSELLAIVIDGPQEKKETLDNFYQEYSEWNKNNIEKTKNDFYSILEDLKRIFPLNIAPISKTRFKQKADFYSLFAAISELHKEGHFIEGKDIDQLIDDFNILHTNIYPESDVREFSEYAIKCASQANNVNSRNWRKNFIKDILKGTYIGKPDEKTINRYHNILWDLCEKSIEECCPDRNQKCPLCKNEIKNYDKKMVKLTWGSAKKSFQLSNAIFIHIDCWNNKKD